MDGRGGVGSRSHKSRNLQDGLGRTRKNSFAFRSYEVRRVFFPEGMQINVLHWHELGEFN